MPKDVTAADVYADRELLNRLGYGIFDVQFTKDGSIGSENIHDFTYLVAQDDDPRLYRRKIFELVGRYYPNKSAKQIWDKMVDHKWVLSEQLGHEVDLKTAAEDWIKKYSHDFLKEWTFQQPKVPFRIRSHHEPRKSWLGVVTGYIFPNLRELLDAGFTVTDIIVGTAKEANPVKSLKLQKKRSPLRLIGKKADKTAETAASTGEKYFVVQRTPPHNSDFFYIRLVANLTGHEIKKEDEAAKRWREILEHKWYMSEREGHDVGLRAAAVDYYRRLNFLAEAESGVES